MRQLESFFDDVGAMRAHAALIRKVFRVAPAVDGSWCPFGLFEGSVCVAAAEARRLPLETGAATIDAGAIRRVAVDPAWRGRGLMRIVMTDALRWCAAHAFAPVLLFTETPALYTSLGFAPVAQHAFVGPQPSFCSTTSPARSLDFRRNADRARLAERLASRKPISARGGLAGAADLVAANIAAALDLACLELPSGLVVVDRESSELTIVDVIAPEIPPMATILSALERRPGEIRTLFSPDRLAWPGVPRLEANGLMARGALPPALHQPFMLPPTAEF